MSVAQWVAAKRGGNKLQLYFIFHQFTHYWKSVIQVTKNPCACYICDQNIYTKCGVCDEYLDTIWYKGPKKDKNGLSNTTILHNLFYVRTISGWQTDAQKSKWTMPNVSEMKLNECYMRVSHKSTLNKEDEWMWLVEKLTTLNQLNDVSGTCVCRELRW